MALLFDINESLLYDSGSPEGLKRKIRISRMVYAKTELFDEQLRETAGLFKAWLHPARRRIIQYPAETRTCITGDISGEPSLRRHTGNRHLSELKKAGLIMGQVSGIRTNYCLNGKKMECLKKVFNVLFGNVYPVENNC